MLSAAYNIVFIFALAITSNLIAVNIAQIQVAPINKIHS